MKNSHYYLQLFISFLLLHTAVGQEFSTAGFFQEDANVREAINFNIGWRFVKKDVKGAEAVDFDDRHWTLVNLPNGMELLPLTASGGVNYQGPSWYRKHFTPLESFKGKKVMLHFEGIMGKCKIWVNGQLLEEHFGSYYPMHLDISEYLIFGKDNIIAVRPDNSNDPMYPPGKPQETLDFTYFGGIYRDAWLVVHNKIYVTHPLEVDKVAGGGVFMNFTKVSEKSATVNIAVDIENEEDNDTYVVKLVLKDKFGMSVAHALKSMYIKKGTSKNIRQNFKVSNPTLWSPESPSLYNLFVEVLSSKGKRLDYFRKRIGIRSIELKGAEGFYLNGKLYPHKLLGANRHQDFAHIGHALPNNLHYRDALKLRQAGMRVVRSAHYIQDPAFMDACDELGLFIVTAIPGWQYWNEKPIFMERMLKDVRNLYRLERNRPSVLLWEIVPNETHFPDEYAVKATKAAKEEFPHSENYTSTDARTHRSKAQKYFDVLYANDQVAAHPEKSIFKREWGDFVDNWVDHNSLSRVAKQWGEVPQLKQAMHYFKAEWEEEGAFKEWPSMTMIYKSSPSLFGATMWHPFDHQRGYHPDPFWGGIMDAYRQPKFSYYLFKSLLPTKGLENVPNVTAEPFVYIAHLMSPFSPEDVVVFTNCDEVKLSMYGKEIGIHKASSTTSLVPRVPVVFKKVFRNVDARNKNKKGYGKINQPYVEDALMVAEGIVDGKVVTSHKRWPVGRKRRLVLKVDDSNIQPIADGSDITSVVAYLVDAGGAVKRLSDEYVKFTVTGAGTLIEGEHTGMNPQKMLWGEAVALVRSGIEPGEIKVRAEVLIPSVNGPSPAEIVFTTLATKKRMLYAETPLKANKTTNGNSENMDSMMIQQLKDELLETQKQLQDYKINEVGKQQQDFIQ